MQPHELWAVIALLTLAVLVEKVEASPSLRIDRPGLVRLIAEETPAEAPDVATGSDQAQERVYIGNETLEACMQRWDAAAHMTKEEWRQSCKRIKEERAPYAGER